MGGRRSGHFTCHRAAELKRRRTLGEDKGDAAGYLATWGLVGAKDGVSCCGCILRFDKATSSLTRQDRVTHAANDAPSKMLPIGAAICREVDRNRRYLAQGIGRGEQRS